MVPIACGLCIQQHVSKLSDAALVLQPQNPLCFLITSAQKKSAEVHLMRKYNLCLSAYKNNILLELINEKAHFILCMV